MTEDTAPVSPPPPVLDHENSSPGREQQFQKMVTDGAAAEGGPHDLLDEIVAQTQQLLSSANIEKPRLTADRLKKPPFRFLFDFLHALIEKFPEELEDLKTSLPGGGSNSSQPQLPNSKQEKCDWLDAWIIAVMQASADRNPFEPPSSLKVVCGQEAEKTNLLLQRTWDMCVRNKEELNKPIPADDFSAALATMTTYNQKWLNSKEYEKVQKIEMPVDLDDENSEEEIEHLDNEDDHTKTLEIDPDRIIAEEDSDGEILTKEERVRKQAREDLQKDERFAKVQNLLDEMDAVLGSDDDDGRNNRNTRAGGSQQSRTTGSTSLPHSQVAAPAAPLDHNNSPHLMMNRKLHQQEAASFAQRPESRGERLRPSNQMQAYFQQQQQQMGHHLQSGQNIVQSRMGGATPAAYEDNNSKLRPYEGSSSSGSGSESEISDAESSPERMRRPTQPRGKNNYPGSSLDSEGLSSASPAARGTRNEARNNNKFPKSRTAGGGKNGARMITSSTSSAHDATTFGAPGDDDFSEESDHGNEIVLSDDERRKKKKKEKQRQQNVGQKFPQARSENKHQRARMVAEPIVTIADANEQEEKELLEQQLIDLQVDEQHAEQDSSGLTLNEDPDTSNLTIAPGEGEEETLVSSPQKQLQGNNKQGHQNLKHIESEPTNVGTDVGEDALASAADYEEVENCVDGTSPGGGHRQRAKQQGDEQENNAPPEDEEQQLQQLDLASLTISSTVKTISEEAVTRYAGEQFLNQLRQNLENYVTFVANAPASSLVKQVQLVEKNNGNEEEDEEETDKTPEQRFYQQAVVVSMFQQILLGLQLHTRLLSSSGGAEQQEMITEVIAGSLSEFGLVEELKEKALASSSSPDGAGLVDQQLGTAIRTTSSLLHFLVTKPSEKLTTDVAEDYDELIEIFQTLLRLEPEENVYACFPPIFHPEEGEGEEFNHAVAGSEEFDQLNGIRGHQPTYQDEAAEQMRSSYHLTNRRFTNTATNILRGF
ncbi:unnamed protein product [Amoebophrya sp. A120]|nr:unnamed protein product [Amoebophrya sp. A120]|eukprot:GSA120T00020511001.1